MFKSGNRDSSVLWQVLLTPHLRSDLILNNININGLGYLFMFQQTLSREERSYWERKEIQFYLPLRLTYYIQATFTCSPHPWHGSEVRLVHPVPLLTVAHLGHHQLRSPGSSQHLSLLIFLRKSSITCFNSQIFSLHLLLLLSKPSFPPPFLQDNFFPETHHFRLPFEGHKCLVFQWIFE